MKQYRGRPIIEATDSPLVVDKALHRSVSYFNKNMPKDVAFFWQKRAADAWGMVEDGFRIIGGEVRNPKGDALLRGMSPDELGLSLVAYGCEIIDKQDPQVDVEILAIDGLLKEIDRIKQT